MINDGYEELKCIFRSLNNVFLLTLDEMNIVPAAKGKPCCLLTDGGDVT